MKKKKKKNPIKMDISTLHNLYLKSYFLVFCNFDFTIKFKILNTNFDDDDHGITVIK